MTSGRDIAQENVLKFTSWMASKSDNEFRAMAGRGVLSRKEIATECGFSKSALDQNPRIKLALRDLEDGLRLRGVLPPEMEKNTTGAVAPLMREPSALRGALEAERYSRLETDYALLKAENGELKRALEKFSVLRDALAQTGRLPR
jgi:hypothetical protein